MELLDVQGLDEWAADQLPGTGSTRATKIEGGASNEMFLLERDGGRAVLRRPPAHRTSKTSQDILRETKILRALEATSVPVPRVLAVCEDDAVIGSPFYVMTFVDGFTPRDPLPEPFASDAGALRALCMALIEGLASIANVDWRAVGLDGFGKPDGFLDRQVPRWLTQLETYRTRDIPRLDDVASWLQSNTPRTSDPAIMHGDYQFINVMAERDMPARLAAIVDWEQATIGDPLLDLGWVIAGWSEPGEELRFGSRYLKDRTASPSRADLVKRYEELTGRDTSTLDYYIVLSLFKLACVLEGSYHRFATGKSTHPMHERMGPLVLRAIEQADHTARSGEW
ncbi:MAG: phosphotransferase family protein [Actinobacteria bacterium]|nr:phosphotransferase family protein [Actinomycetota bacterium]